MCSITMETRFLTSLTAQVSDFEGLKLEDVYALRVEQGVRGWQFWVTADVLPIQDILSIVKNYWDPGNGYKRQREK